MLFKIYTIFCVVDVTPDHLRSEFTWLVRLRSKYMSDVREFCQEAENFYHAVGPCPDTWTHCVIVIIVSQSRVEQNCDEMLTMAMLNDNKDIKVIFSS